MDREFLDELVAIGIRAPEWTADALWGAYQATESLEQRRAFAVRILAEFAQAAELFCLLVLAVRQRSERPLVLTFVEHGTEEVLQLITELTRLTKPITVGQLLHAPEPRQDTEQGRVFEAVTAHGRELVATFGLERGVIRRFYSKSKHGFTIVRSINLNGPPFFGPSPDMGVWAIYQAKPENGTPPGRGEMDVAGFPATPGLVEKMAGSCRSLSIASLALARLIGAGIQQRVL